MDYGVLQFITSNATDVAKNSTQIEINYLSLVKNMSVTATNIAGYANEINSKAEYCLLS